MSFFGSIYADPDLLHRARTVYMYLCDRAGGGSWPGGLSQILCKHCRAV